MKISAVIACYRDAPAVPLLHARLTATFEKIGADYEIIFVNDASPDDAKQVLAELAARDRKVVVINHSRNFGSQSAFSSGLLVATGDAAVLLDGDLQDPPELIEEFHREWKKGFEVVYAVRVEREGSWFLRISTKMFYRMFRALAYVPAPLDAGDFSLLDRRVIDVLNGMPEANRFVRAMRAWAGFRQTGVPYKRPARMFGSTTNNLLKNLGWTRRALLSLSYAPLDLIVVLALVTIVISLGLGVWRVAQSLLYPTAPEGDATLLIVVLFLGGVQMLCLSILGAYVAQIHEEVKRRPAFLVESIWNDPRQR